MDSAEELRHDDVVRVLAALIVDAATGGPLPTARATREGPRRPRWVILLQGPAGCGKFTCVERSIREAQAKIARDNICIRLRDVSHAAFCRACRAAEVRRLATRRDGPSMPRPEPGGAAALPHPEEEDLTSHCVVDVFVLRRAELLAPRWHRDDALVASDGPGQHDLVVSPYAVDDDTAELAVSALTDGLAARRAAWADALDDGPSTTGATPAAAAKGAGGAAPLVLILTTTTMDGDDGGAAESTIGGGGGSGDVGGGGGGRGPSTLHPTVAEFGCDVVLPVSRSLEPSALRSLIVAALRPLCPTDGNEPDGGGSNGNANRLVAAACDKLANCTAAAVARGCRAAASIAVPLLLGAVERGAVGADAACAAVLRAITDAAAAPDRSVECRAMIANLNLLSTALQPTTGSPRLEPASAGAAAAVRWADVVGLDGVKAELLRCLWSDAAPSAEAAHQSPTASAGRRPTLTDLYRGLGVPPPAGVLLYGVPGTGKTHLAKALAATLGSSFVYVSIAGIVRGEVGESERLLRASFAEALRRAPSIVFLDEMQAIFGRREPTIAAAGQSLCQINGGADSESFFGSPSSSGGHPAAGSHEARLVIALLNAIDSCRIRNMGTGGSGVVGAAASSRVVVVGATNVPQWIDPALLASGRLDVQLLVSPPTGAEVSAYAASVLRTVWRWKPQPLRNGGAAVLEALEAAVASDHNDDTAAARQPGAARAPRWTIADVSNALNLLGLRVALTSSVDGEGPDLATAEEDDSTPSDGNSLDDDDAVWLERFANRSPPTERDTCAVRQWAAELRPAATAAMVQAIADWKPT